MNDTLLTLQCVYCKHTYPPRPIRYRCECGNILDIHVPGTSSLSQKELDLRLLKHKPPYTSGVWRYKEFLPPIPLHHIMSKAEGNTRLYHVGNGLAHGASQIGRYVGVNDLFLKHEGENPTGSFKDRGMTVGVSAASWYGSRAVACASTGNTSASLASYASLAGIPCFIFLPDTHVSSSKLSQTIAYGATPITIDGDFDDCMQTVERISISHDIYLVNSINPFRIEGQKTIAYELIHQLGWKSPDWIIIPGGNLGNTSAIGKGILDLFERKWIRRLPRIATIQAEGASPFYQSYLRGFSTFSPMKAHTIATAIKIGNPVSYLRAKEIIEKTHGIVASVTDSQILEAKSMIDRAGIGCEPGSATSIAGLKKLVQSGHIKPSDSVVCIITGHLLKDPDTTMHIHTTQPIKATKKTIESIVAQLVDS